MATKAKGAKKAADDLAAKQNAIVDPTTGEVIADDIDMFIASAAREGVQAAQRIEEIVYTSINDNNVILDKDNCEHLMRMFRSVYKDFTVQKMEADERFNWKIRIRVPEVMKNIRHDYNIVLTYNPRPALRGIRDAILQEIEEAAKPRLFDGDGKSEATERKLKYLGMLQSESGSYQRFVFAARVIAHKGCTVNDEDGTELHMRVEAGDAGALNVLREELGHYSLRFEQA